LLVVVEQIDIADYAEKFDTMVNKILMQSIVILTIK